MIRKSQSPDPAVDYVPVLLAAARDLHPCFWATPWENAWTRLPRAGRHLMGRASINEIPCLNVKPDGPARGVYRGAAKRMLLPVVYVDCVAEARAAWSLQRTSACKSMCPDKVQGFWAEIAALVPQGRETGRLTAAA